MLSFKFYAQLQLGMRLDNYNGLQSLQLNPANSMDLKNKWELNLVSGGAFLSNSYFLFENTTILGLIANSDKIGPNPRLKDVFPVRGATIFYNYYDYPKTAFAASQVSVSGPSFQTKINDNTSIGIYSSYKMIANADDLPTKIGYYDYERQLYYDVFDLEPFEVNVMTWGELGINYAKKFNYDDHSVTIGGNLKYLMKNTSIYFKNNSVSKMAKLNKDSIRFDLTNFELGLVQDYSKVDKIFNVNGNGNLGLDLGFTYSKFGFDSEDIIEKYSVSIVDIGGLTFNQDAEIHQGIVNTSVSLRNKDYNNVDAKNVYPKIRQFSNLVYNDSIKSKIGNGFTMGLPTSFIFNYDRKINNNLYVNALVSQSIQIHEHQVRNANILAVSPRFQKYWYTISTPLSLVNYRNLQVGLSMRIGPLTIGSDNFLPFIIKQDINSADMYFAIKVPGFKLGQKNKFKKGVRCYW
jgi:hypothetical protein